MPVIGLTGSIASGKSLVTTILKELGAEIIDADKVAREVVEPGTRGWQQVRRKFGDGILNQDGSINRKALGNLVFSNPGKMEILNSITHPLILDRIQGEIDRFRKSHTGVREGVMVVDAPLLLETGLFRIVDEVWLVEIPFELQVDRLMHRDGISKDQAIKRISSQMPVEEKRKYADVIIDNSGTRERTRRVVESIWKQHY